MFWYPPTVPGRVVYMYLASHHVSAGSNALLVTLNWIFFKWKDDYFCKLLELFVIANAFFPFPFLYHKWVQSANQSTSHL